MIEAHTHLQASAAAHTHSMNLFLFVALLLEGVSALQPATGVWRPQAQMTRSRPAVCQKRDASGYLAEDELGDWTVRSSRFESL